MSGQHQHPEQPDGINPDSRDLPTPVRAARRILAYVAMAGDGCYDVCGDRPLYGRDLEAVCRSIVGRQS